MTFRVPTQVQDAPQTAPCFRFSVPEVSVLFAGSRFLEVPLPTCRELVERFAGHGFNFFVGCAEGVDRSFRRTIAYSPYRHRCFVACAFPQRTSRFHTYGLFATVVVPNGLPPKAALHRRTLWMVKRCSLAVLFPERPGDRSWGKGSRLVFQSSLCHLKPLFVVCSTPPPRSVHYRVLPSKLFGVVEGYWVVPHPVSDGGTCDEEY